MKTKLLNFVLAIGTIFIVVLVGGRAKAEERDFPTLRDREIAERVDDCSVYRSMASRMKAVVLERQAVLNDVMALSRTNRQAFEACAKQNGIQKISTDEDEMKAADSCYALYKTWLEPSYRLLVLREDIDQETSTLSQAQDHLQYYCGTKVF